MKLIRNRLFLATICVVLSALCVYSFLQSNTSEDVTAYKLNTNISQGTQITDEMLTSVTIGTKGMDNVVLDENEIIGSYAATDLANGQIIIDTLLVDTQADVIQGFDKLEDGKIAFTISSSSLASSVANKLQSGDIVSVYVNTNGVSTQPILLKYVEVLYVSTSTGADKTETDEESISVITLIVNEEQALLLNEYEYTSNLHLALISRGDETLKQEYLTAQELLQEEYIPAEQTEDDVTDSEEDVLTHEITE
ncbi:Flp pilus assembly protein CpaB [Tannockella kyphosi]|uniref:Flp pilus assembly protein CpaB n=1 Tax=Tannockella kyphosi TaxID=2899121 RepID=UPI002012C535|nr:RcpC/CpaB family pilus assembly protein [Tannockella kyphosi]